MKKSLSILLLMMVGFLLFSNSVSATEYGEFKDEDGVHYHLDMVPDDADDGFFDNGEQGSGFWDWVTNFSDSAGDQITIIFNWFANLAFQFNIMMTNFMIWAMDFAYDFEFVNILIDEISDVMRKISGISSVGMFQNTGVFGNLAIFVTILAVSYAVFILLFKKSMFKSLGAILQTTLCLTLAILMFTNYSPFLKGINQVTTELSAMILSGGGTDRVTEEPDDPTQPSPVADEETPTGLSEASLRSQMEDNLWGMFVDRPYLYMMYGETELADDVEESNNDTITKERVGSLLRERPNGDGRLQVLQNEYNEYRNTAITYSNVTNRIAFTPVYLGVNGMMGFFVWFLALALIAVQFWFLLIALFAPFALLIGAVPGMFNVMKRYAIELVIPLAVKILLSFGALMIFAMSDVLFQLNFELGNTVGQMSSLAYYVAAGIVNLVLFALLFILRKRISSIFVNSNNFISEVRDGAGQLTDPAKKGMQNVATATGVAAGAAIGGLHGATVGAQAGNLAGKTITGEASSGDYAAMAGTMAREKMYSRLDNKNGQQQSNLDDNPTQNVIDTDRQDDDNDNNGNPSLINNDPPDNDEKCPKCGQNPCICGDGNGSNLDSDDVCPRCKQNPCICNDDNDKPDSYDNTTFIPIDNGTSEENNMDYEDLETLSEQHTDNYSNFEDDKRYEDFANPTNFENVTADEIDGNNLSYVNENDETNYSEMENMPDNQNNQETRYPKFQPTNMDYNSNDFHPKDQFDAQDNFSSSEKGSDLGEQSKTDTKESNETPFLNDKTLSDEYLDYLQETHELDQESNNNSEDFGKTDTSIPDEYRNPDENSYSELDRGLEQDKNND